MASIGATPPQEIFKTTNKQVIWMWSHEVLVNSSCLSAVRFESLWTQAGHTGTELTAPHSVLEHALHTANPP